MSGNEGISGLPSYKSNAFSGNFSLWSKCGIPGAAREVLQKSANPKVRFLMYAYGLVCQGMRLTPPPST
jgi:hypothetical protein